MYVGGRYQTAHVATHCSVLYQSLSHHIKLWVLSRADRPLCVSERHGEDRLISFGRERHLAAVLCQNFSVSVLERNISVKTSRGYFSACLIHLNTEPVTGWLEGSLRAPPQRHLLLHPPFIELPLQFALFFLFSFFFFRPKCQSFSLSHCSSVQLAKTTLTTSLVRLGSQTTQGSWQ